MGIFGSKTAEDGLVARHDRRNKFRITRIKDASGFHQYILENQSRGEKIFIPRFLLDRFRAVIRSILQQELEVEKEAPIDVKVYFKDIDYYALKSTRDDRDKLSIQEIKPAPGSTGFLSLDLGAVKTLDALLYSSKMGHPNDILNRIIAYHKLFSFTFTEGSESITSNLTLRKDVLAQVNRYLPSLGKKEGEVSVLRGREDGDDFEKLQDLTDKKGKKEEGLFRSKLAEKDGEKSYQVDYESLFDRAGGCSIDKAPKAADNVGGKKDAPARSKTYFPLPMLASEVKNFTRVPFKVELTAEEIKEMRDHFLGDRQSEFFIGFEIVDAIFRHGSKLSTFRFPLYYLKVTIEESGRQIFIVPQENGTFYLNHLALANLVETFGKSSGSGDVVDNFFKTLLAQKIEVNNKMDKIHLSRMLPVDEAVFDKTREILIGQPGENGKGGILDNLQIVGIESDLESIALYKASKTHSPIEVALEEDLERIMHIAHDNPERFYSSLLGRFLTPEIHAEDEGVKVFAQRSFMPGAMPAATRTLLDKLNQHNLVLLEGPPGTGKTFTNMNLFFHCVNSGKRLLIVSDQKAALGALTEKIEEYLVGRDRESPYAKNMLALWKIAIKVVDDIPSSTDSLQNWVRDLRAMLAIENQKELDWPVDQPIVEQEILEVDQEMARCRALIAEIMHTRMGPDSEIRKRVTPKRQHATTVDDIDSLIAFLRFVGSSSNKESGKNTNENLRRHLVHRYIKDREYLIKSEWKCVYDYLAIDENMIVNELESVQKTGRLLEALIKHKPRSHKRFKNLLGGIENNSIVELLTEKWQHSFPPFASRFMKIMHYLVSLVYYPNLKLARILHRILVNHQAILQIGLDVEPGVMQELRMIHDSLAIKEAPPLALEICRFSVESMHATDVKMNKEPIPSVHELLEHIGSLQEKRDELLKTKYLGRLGTLARSVFHADSSGGTNPATSITSLLDNLKICKSITHGSGVAVLKELQLKLLETFPIWLCRKQVVPFLFPTLEHAFDLIIVDEAGQCRVDDALPLLFRANKLMVVGDDKQTVLAKNSFIDDYLFNEFDLDEHLRTTQARGIKGGGSHLFGLVKTIKQAAVMLDEHYRCPPDIIQFSNKYVYGNDLKVMQWMHPNQPPVVEVDYSEQQAPISSRPVSGKFKSIETDMVDRFLEYVAGKIKSIEKESGEKINMETDVALCYFLLKNEVYVKSVKGEFLRRLARGDDVLDGAGAALQGKERNYIFYFWDINRSNMMAFRQGDDVDKRKGELNVLMSRPKRRAYHFLHKNFASLDHNTATISDYLWKTYKTQSDQKQIAKFVPRKARPGKEFIPWRRSSGLLMRSILLAVLERKKKRGAKLKENLDIQSSIAVGDPSHRVDIMIIPSGASGAAVGVVDLCGFDVRTNCVQDVVDYYFQLQRACPPINPVFLFIHELADERSVPFQAIENYIENQQSGKMIRKEKKMA